MSIASVATNQVSEEFFNFPDHSLSESIFILITQPGSVIPMRVLESESIASVKLRIQSSEGVVMRKQKLVFQGRELARNNSRIHDYGVTDGNVLHLVIRFSNLQAITVKTVCGKVFEFNVERSRNIGYVKKQIANMGKDIVDLDDQELVCDGEELEDRRIIYDICKNNKTVIHLLVRKSAKVRSKSIEKEFEISIVSSDLNVERDFLLEPLIVNPKIELLSVVKELISSSYDGLAIGNQPIMSSEGSGGVYFMQDSSGHKCISVFKPIDEEPMAVNNPRGLPLSSDGGGLKKGTRVGEGGLREVAAYVLDHPFRDNENGFSGVPPTFMVKCLHRAFNHCAGFEGASKNIKIGSLQKFVKNIGSCEDMGPRDFPVDEVHKISVLDIRLANTDRHAGNILVSRDEEDGSVVLIPIDHGYCLPENFEDCTFDWLNWPQSHHPYSPGTIDYIKSLDAELDIELLRSHGWDVPPEVARTLCISTMLLKKGGEERGLTPFDIGSIMCRKTLKTESLIEQIVLEAQDGVLPETSEAAFLESVSQIMDKRLDELYQ